MNLSRSKRIVQHGLPGAFSQKAPVPDDPNALAEVAEGSGAVRVRAGQQPSKHHFHAPSRERATAAALTTATLG